MSRAASCVQLFAFDHMQPQQGRGWVLGHGQEAVGEGSDGTGGEVGAIFFLVRDRREGSAGYWLDPEYTI